MKRFVLAALAAALFVVAAPAAFAASIDIGQQSTVACRKSSTAS